MRLHVLGLPHTQTSLAFSHCAFTRKVARLAPMLAPLGYELVHYGVGDAPDTTGWAAHVPVMTVAEQTALLGYEAAAPGPAMVGRSAQVDTPLYRAFNQRLAAILQAEVGVDDWVCAPFGVGHAEALWGFLDQTLETGIGYPAAFAKYRVYESQAWFHWHLGRDQRQPWVSEWVVPNYFDPAEWPLRPTPPSAGAYVLYLGRLQEDKGLNVVRALALARPDLAFVLCGQGDATPWLGPPNLHYQPPVHGLARAALFHGARCVLMPTAYVEPFGGVAVEAMLTGTPVLTSDHSAFTETNDCASCRCRTKVDWLNGLETVLARDPATLRHKALRKYSLEAVGPQFDRVFQQLPLMRAYGWDAREERVA